MFKNNNLKILTPIILILASFVLIFSANVSFAVRENEPYNIPGVTATGTTQILTDCDRGYPPTNDTCKAGDHLKKCPAAAGREQVLCVATLGKIGGGLRPYTVQVPIPCDPRVGLCPSEQTPAGYIARLYTFSLMIAGLLAFASIVYGSVKYILSAGIVSMQTEAKEQITQAIFGLVLLLGAFIILYTINPNLVNLRNPSLEVINIKQIINEAKVEEGGQKLAGTTGGGGDPLCQDSISGTVGLDVNYRINPNAVGGNQDIGLTSGQKTTGDICLNCVANAHREGDVLGVGGKCVCNDKFVYSSDEQVCISEAASQTKCPPDAAFINGKCQKVGF